MVTQVLLIRWGCLPPVDMGDDVVRAARLQCDLYNELIRVHRDCREEHERLVGGDPEVAAVDVQVATLRAEQAAIVEAVKGRGAPARRRGSKTNAEDGRMTALKRELSALWSRRKGLAAAARERLRVALDELDGRQNRLVTEARQRSAAAGLWWPNYNAVVARADTARQDAVHGGELRERPWRGPDIWTTERACSEWLSFTFQVQGGMTAEVLHAGRRRQLAVTPPQEGAYDHPSRGERGRRQRGVATIAVAAVEGGFRTLSVPVLMHRPVPPGYLIKQATLKHADRWRWHLTLTCTRQVEDLAEVPEGDACGVDVGWRARPDGGLRVAVVAWSPNDVEEVVLPPRWMDEMDRAEAEQGRLDVVAQEALARLRAELPVVRRWAESVPPEGREDADLLVARLVTTATNTKSSAWTLRRVVHWWQRVHPDDLADVRAWFSDWLRDEIRGRHSQEGWAAKLRGQRRDMFRCAVKQIAARASVVGLDDSDMSRIAVVDHEDGSAPDMPPPVRAARVRASASEFRRELKRATASARKILVAYRSQTNLCHACGEDPRPSDPSDLHWRCAGCGSIYDQDHNSGHLLRARAEADAPEQVAGAAAKKRPPRSERMRAASAAKRAGDEPIAAG